MSNFPYKNPISPEQLNGIQSVGRTEVFGTNYSVLGIGGYMEVYNLSDLDYTIPIGDTGTISLSSNTIPINFIKGDGSLYSPDVLVMGSDNISSGRRRLAILSALYLKKQQFIFVNEVALNDVKTVKTKNIVKFISDLGLNSNERILFILTKPNKEFWLASRNLKNVEVTTSNCLNIEQLLKTTHIILSNTSLDSINSIYGKQYA